MKMLPAIILIVLVSMAWMLFASEYNLDDPITYRDAFMRVRGDSSGQDVVYYWSGTVYSFEPQKKKLELFKLEGFNIAKTVVNEDGFELWTREAAFFEDPRTGDILESWNNPLNDSLVQVIQIWNDPVNQDLTFEPEYLPYITKILPSMDLGDQLCFHMEIFPYYPSPLPRSKYPQFSQNDIYQAAEFFQFYADKTDLSNPALTSVPVSISWTRMSPWMPFMRMGDRTGNLLFSCRGMKLKGGFEALPDKIKKYVKLHKPEYCSAPSEYYQPNETSWTYFRKLTDQGIIK